MPEKLQDRHGAAATGLAKAKMGGMGIYPQQGTTNPQDIARKVSGSQVGDDSGPRPAKTNGIKNLSRTGGQGHKFAGKVGFQKATGTT